MNPCCTVNTCPTQNVANFKEQSHLNLAGELDECEENSVLLKLILFCTKGTARNTLSQFYFIVTKGPRTCNHF